MGLQNETWNVSKIYYQRLFLFASAFDLAYLVVISGGSDKMTLKKNYIQIYLLTQKFGKESENIFHSHGKTMGCTIHGKEFKENLPSFFRVQLLFAVVFFRKLYDWQIKNFHDSGLFSSGCIIVTPERNCEETIPYTSSCNCIIPIILLRLIKS